VAKKPNKEKQKEYEEAVEFGCIVCFKLYGVYSQPCIHHLTGAGVGLKHRDILPLCHTHHQGKEGIHHLGTFTWEKKYGTQRELLEFYKRRKVGSKV
tara:strand:+ start:5072 stop:5362 length:291 start_codon:yes stop_codon:yes gene_type:complete